MSLSRRSSFFRARAGKSDANAQAIIEGLRRLGHFVIPVRSSDAGVADICVYRLISCSIAHAAWPVWIELKEAKGRLRKSQVDWRATARARGVRTAVARTLEECLEALR